MIALPLAMNTTLAPTVTTADLHMGTDSAPCLILARNAAGVATCDFHQGGDTENDGAI